MAIMEEECCKKYRNKTTKESKSYSEPVSLYLE